MAKLNLGEPLEWEIRYTDREDAEAEEWYVNVDSKNGYFDAQQIDSKKWDFGGHYQTAAIIKVYWPLVMAGTWEEILGGLKKRIIRELEERGCVEYNDCGSRFYVPQNGNAK